MHIFSQFNFLVDFMITGLSSSDAVWAEGLLIFYEIYRFLEEAMKRHKEDLLGKLLLEGMERTKAFEEDLRHYLGENWTTFYSVRPQVAEYLLHLDKLEKQDSDLLMAYVYHLYMGLLSGGQILSKKREAKAILLLRPVELEGCAVTNFNGVSIGGLKREMKRLMNEIADTLDDEKKEALIEESKNVFRWNHKIIATVEVNNTALFQLMPLMAFIFTVFIIIFLVFRHINLV